MKQIFNSKSIADTFQIARDFALQLKAGDKIALCGELGAGKTHFAKGIIAELTHYSEMDITSPTFTLIEEFEGKIPLYHLDFYRLSRPEELQELDADILFGAEGITIIEWAERFPELFKVCRYQIFLRKISAEQREIEIQTHSSIPLQ